MEKEIFNLLGRVVMGGAMLYMALSVGGWLWWSLFAVNVVLAIAWLGMAINSAQQSVERTGEESG